MSQYNTFHEAPATGVGESKTTQSSVSAATSMTFGIMSPIVLCSCLPTILTSLLAIVLGHIALVKIKRSDGKLTGRGRAITGLALGYPFLIISIVLVPTFFNRLENFRTGMANVRQQVDQHAASDPMRVAEQQIQFSSHSVASGNTPEAKALAKTFSNTLSQHRDLLIVRSDGEEEHKGDFQTYCQDNGDSVCFLVYVPEYRKYEGDAKDVMAEAAWLATVTTLSESDRTVDCEVAVGLKGNLLYGAVMIGNVNEISRPRITTEKSQLTRFFQPDE